MYSDEQLRALATAVLGFANMRPEDAGNPDAVAALFKEWFAWPRELDAVLAPEFQKDRERLLRRLGQLAAGKRDSVLAFTAAEFDKDPHFIVGRVQRVNGTLQVTEQGPQQLRALTTALWFFLDELASRPAMLKYFGRCALPECALFFLKGPTGKPSGFCCDKHQRKAHKRGITLKNLRGA